MKKIKTLFEKNMFGEKIALATKSKTTEKNPTTIYYSFVAKETLTNHLTLEFEVSVNFQRKEYTVFRVVPLDEQKFANPYVLEHWKNFINELEKEEVK